VKDGEGKASNLEKSVTLYTAGCDQEKHSGGRQHVTSWLPHKNMPRLWRMRGGNGLHISNMQTLRFHRRGHNRHHVSSLPSHPQMVEKDDQEKQEGE